MQKVSHSSNFLNVVATRAILAAVSEDRPLEERDLLDHMREIGFAQTQVWRRRQALHKALDFLGYALHG